MTVAVDPQKISFRLPSRSHLEVICGLIAARRLLNLQRTLFRQVLCLITRYGQMHSFGPRVDHNTKKGTIVPGLLRSLAILALVAAWIAPQLGGAESVPRMSPEQLQQQIDSADLIVIDVRTSRSWKLSQTKIAGAIREDASRVDEWANKYPKTKTLVFYCA